MFTTRRSGRASSGTTRVRRDGAGARFRRAVVIGIALHGAPGFTAQPIWRGEPMHYFARDTPLPDMLREVVSAGGLQVKVSPGMKEPVNGAFNEAPERVFARLIEAYGLAWYFDGHVIHVSRASDIRSRTIPFAPMTRNHVADLLSNLGLDDSHLPVRYSDTTAVVSGPAEYVDAIADAVEQAQEQAVTPPAAADMAIRVFALRYAQAQDITYTSNGQQHVVPGVASLLRKLMADVPLPAPDVGTPASTRQRRRELRGGPSPLPSLRGLGLADSAPALEMPLPDAEVIHASATPMRRNIVADARTNSIVIYDSPSMMQNYERTIAMLDKPQDLVEITAAVIDVSSDAAHELGIRWSGSARGRWGTATAVADGAAAATGALNASMLPRVDLATMIGNSGARLFARIRALEQSGKARILSRPQVLTLNNTEAVLSSRNSVYVRVAGNQDVDLFNVDTGLTLKVTPTVEPMLGDARSILLSVQIDDGAFDASGAVDGIPKVNHNSIVTQAVIEDGQSLLVGGYEYERSTKSSSGVPVLSAIPLVGRLFSDRQGESQRVERLILITPRIKSMTNPAARSGATTRSWPASFTQPVGRPDAGPSLPARTLVPSAGYGAPPLPGASNTRNNKNNRRTR